jgi:hypothetical protein
MAGLFLYHFVVLLLMAMAGLFLYHFFPAFQLKFHPLFAHQEKEQ